MTDISTNIGTQYNILAGTGRHMEVSRLVTPLSERQTEDLVPGCMMMASVINSVALSAWDGDRDNPILGVLLEAVTTGPSAISCRILARGSVKNAQCHVYDAGGNLQLLPVQWDHARKCGIVPVGNEYRALGRFFGVVTNEDDAPLEGIIVGRYEPGGTLQEFVTTDEFGEFEMNAPIGTWDFLFGEDTPTTYVNQFIEDVEITDQGEHEQDIELEFRVGGLGGVVSDNDDPANLLAGASIIVYTTDPGAPEYGPELSGADGVYAFTGIRVGTYNVKATLAGHDDEVIEDVEITHNASTDLDIELEFHTGGIFGVISDNDNPANPLEGASVIVYTTDPGAPEYGPVLSGADGTYAIPNIRIGTYNILATLANHDDELMENVVIAHGPQAEINITLDVTT
jgi:hypothetical protein